MVAEAFDLGRPIVSLVPHRFGAISEETWTLTTLSGEFVVMRLWAGPDPPWRHRLEQAMELERRAWEAGTAVMRPIPPRTPAFGFAARVHGYGLFRVYERPRHRVLARSDEIAEWLGTTLARLHRLMPLAAAPSSAPEWYSFFREQEWRQWLEAGELRGLAWAPALRKRFPMIAEASAWIAEAFASAAGYVVTHRAVEPRNVWMTASGPILVDWHGSGPDSAPLEAAHAVVSVAMLDRRSPEPERVRRAVAAYVAEGGQAPPAGRAAVARYVGMRLSHVARLIRATLDVSEGNGTDSSHEEVSATQELERLPAMIEESIAWSELFR